MPRRAPSGGRFAAPCADPPLPICDLNSLWTHAYEKLMAENRRLIAANSSEPGTYLDYSNFLMASNVADNVLALWAFDEPGWVEKARHLTVGTVATRSPALFPDACPGGA